MVGATRDLTKAKAATAGVGAAAANGGGLELVEPDLASLEGVRVLRQRDFKYKTVPQGAATSVWAGAVAAADDVGGRYCEDCHVAAIEPNPAKRAGVKPYALNPETAKALWAKSEEMVSELF